MVMGFVPQPILQDRTSPLLADFETSYQANEPFSNIISANAAIGHDSFVENNIFTTFNNQFFSSPQIDITKIGFAKSGFFKNSISKNSSAEIDLAKDNLSEPSISKINPFHVTVPKTAFVHTDSTEIGKAQINLPKRRRIKVGFAKVGSGVDTASEAFISKISPPKTLPSEILFSPSVEPEQFFSIHNTTPESIDNINNSALSFWNSIIQPQSPFDINLIVKNLTSIATSKPATESQSSQ